MPTYPVFDGHQIQGERSYLSLLNFKLIKISCFITTSRDMTARLFTLDPLEGFRPKTFAGHKDAVVGAYFSANGKFVSETILSSFL
jgi:hypothetical protein